MTRIVIDIPDDDYEYCKQFPYVCMGEWIINSIFSAIKHGTVLPKGHGDLIDRKALTKALKSGCEICGDINTNWCERCCPHNDFEDLIDEAATVIESDKENGND